MEINTIFIPVFIIFALKLKTVMYLDMTQINLFLLSIFRIFAPN